MGKWDEERVKRIERNQEADAIRINRVQSDLHTGKGVDGYNTGDWTTLETVEIGDTVGGVKITLRTQRELIRSTGEAIRVLAEYDKLGKVLNL